jgi:hypothetical protein
LKERQYKKNSDKQRKQHHQTDTNKAELDLLYPFLLYRIDTKSVCVENDCRMTNTRNLFSFLTLLFIVLMISDNAHGLRQKKGVVAVRDPSGSTVTSLRRLKEQLNIGDDPSEDIRTNRLLNMEGI